MYHLSTMTAADMVYCIDAQVRATTTHIDLDIYIQIDR